VIRGGPARRVAFETIIALGQVKEHWRGIGVTLFVNWAVKPFSMAALGWLFVGYLFRPYLPADQIDGYIAGLIILAAAPCTAMVFVWSNLTKGEPHFTLSQVALNDTTMVFAFAPLVGLLLGLSAITVPWDTLLLSVALYIVVLVIAAQIARINVPTRRKPRRHLGTHCEEKRVAPRAGFEPATNRLTAGCSTTELPGNTRAS
jgi:ACR3 family arsenite efflux pump ArsB